MGNQSSSLPADVPPEAMAELLKTSDFADLSKDEIKHMFVAGLEGKSTRRKSIGAGKKRGSNSKVRRKSNPLEITDGVEGVSLSPKERGSVKEIENRRRSILESEMSLKIENRRRSSLQRQTSQKKQAPFSRAMTDSNIQRRRRPTRENKDENHQLDPLAVIQLLEQYSQMDPKTAKQYFKCLQENSPTASEPALPKAA